MEYIAKAVKNQKICGDGEFTKKCDAWIEEKTGTKKSLLTTSCTHALELAALLADIKPGDEVIMPAYTFVSTADAFVLRGAVPVFVDIRPDTMNIDEKLIEAAVTEKTKCIAPVHYAGVSCEMDTIMDIAKRHNLAVIEDAYFYSYDTNALAAFFDKGYDEDRVAVTLRCADEAVYNTFFEELITNQQIFHYLNSVDGRVAFAQDADKFSMTFWLVNE